jgi:hypothetical protein
MSIAGAEKRILQTARFFAVSRSVWMCLEPELFGRRMHQKVNKGSQWNVLSASPNDPRLRLIG